MSDVTLVWIRFIGNSNVLIALLASDVTYREYNLAERCKRVTTYEEIVSLMR